MTREGGVFKRTPSRKDIRDWYRSQARESKVRHSTAGTARAGQDIRQSGFMVAKAGKSVWERNLEGGR